MTSYLLLNLPPLATYAAGASTKISPQLADSAKMFCQQNLMSQQKSLVMTQQMMQSHQKQNFWLSKKWAHSGKIWCVSKNLMYQPVSANLLHPQNVLSQRWLIIFCWVITKDFADYVKLAVLCQQKYLMIHRWHSNLQAQQFMIVPWVYQTKSVIFKMWN